MKLTRTAKAEKIKIDEFTIKVYLKSQKRPIKLVVNNKKMIDDFFEKIKSNLGSVVQFGNFIFSMDDFLCAIYE